jgi:hypothetical protein
MRLQRRHHSKRATAVIGAVALSLLLTACYRPFAEVHQQAHPDTRPWWCHSTGGEGTHGSQYYEDRGITKGMLSWDDCLQLSSYLDDALVYARQWPTRGEAEADGWTASVNYATGMGTHHVRGNALEGTFDPSRPRFLQYDGNGPDAKLVGMSWYVNNGADAPPEGFPGANDWWHTHEYLCVSNQTGLVIRDGQCAAGQDGNSVYLGNYWMVHAWIVPGWLWAPDIFIGHHPCLLPGGPAMPHDACWRSDGHMHEM